MYSQMEKSKENTSHAVANSVTAKKADGGMLNQARFASSDPLDSPLASCPLKSSLVSIVPVRYALDFSPVDEGIDVGKKLRMRGPFESVFSRVEAPLTTCLRQLRDGFLYVYNSTEKTFHEYVVQGHQVYRIKWGDADIGSDVRGADFTPEAKDVRPQLQYARESCLSIAFSPSQISWRLCEKMRSNAGFRAKAMRTINLGSYCKSLKHSHVYPMAQLGQLATDIDEVKDPNVFNGTSMPVIQPDDGGDYKAVVKTSAYMERMEGDEVPLVLALDDKTADLLDLQAQLGASASAYEGWRQENQQKLDMAMMVLKYCEPEIDADKLARYEPQDEVRKQEFYKDLSEAYRKKDLAASIQKASAFVAPQASLSALYTNSQLTKSSSEAKQQFEDVWGMKLEDDDWFKDYQAKAFFRKEVHYDKVKDFSIEALKTRDELLTLYYARHEQALAMLEEIGPHIEYCGLDTELVRDQSLVLSMTSALVQYLCAAPDKSQLARLRKELTRPKTLIGLSHFGFSLVTQQEIEQELEKNDIAIIARAGDEAALVTSEEDKASIATRSAEVQGWGSDEKVQGWFKDTSAYKNATQSFTDGVDAMAAKANQLSQFISNASFKNTGLYQALSQHGQKTMDAFILAAKDISNKQWASLSLVISNQLLPQLDSKSLSSISRMSVPYLTMVKYFMVESWVRGVEFALNQDFSSQYKAWSKKVVTLSRDIAYTQEKIKQGKFKHKNKIKQYKRNTANANRLEAVEGQLKGLDAGMAEAKQAQILSEYDTLKGQLDSELTRQPKLFQLKNKELQTAIDQVTLGLVMEKRAQLAQVNQAAMQRAEQIYAKVEQAAANAIEAAAKQGRLVGEAAGELVTQARAAGKQALEQLAGKHLPIMQQGVSHLFSVGGVLGVLVAYYNGANMIAVAQAANKDDIWSEAEVKHFSYTLFYTVSATTDIIRAVLYSHMLAADLTEGKQISKVVVKKILNESTKYGPKAIWAMQRFCRFSLITSMFAMAAIGTELWKLVSVDYDSSNTELEKQLQFIKGLTLFGQLGVAAIETGAVLSSIAGGVMGVKVGLAFIFNPWLLGAGVLFGLGYLIVSSLINLNKKTNIQMWLRSCCWGVDPKDEWNQPGGEVDAYRAYFDMLTQPGLYLRPTKRTIKLNNTNMPVNVYTQNVPVQDEVQIRDGYWLQLIFPELMQGKHIFITGNKVDDRFWSGDKVTSFGSHVFEQGEWFSDRAPGNLPLDKNAAISPIPKTGSLIYQVWLPLEKEENSHIKEDVDQLVFKIWYPQHQDSQGMPLLEKAAFRFRKDADEEALIEPTCELSIAEFKELETPGLSYYQMEIIKET